MSFFSPKSIEEAYQCALKVEEKLNRRNNSGKGKGQDYKVREDRLKEEKFQFKRRKLNHHVSQNNLAEEETSEEEDLFEEVEEEAEIMRLDVIHVER